MSEQVGGLLATKASYDFNRNTTANYRAASIDPAKFVAWQNTNMYISSYAHFHSKDSVELKNRANPGYGGFIPSVRAESLYGKGYTPISKDSFCGQKLGKNAFGLSTNGFNVTKEVLIDQSKLGSSSKYGKTEIQKAHPAWAGPSWLSSTHDNFRNPKDLLVPTFRETDRFSQTHKPATKGSGFATNHAYLDGTGWNPDRILKGDNDRTEYRDRFNARLDFHRDTSIAKKRKLAPTEWNYKYN